MQALTRWRVPLQHGPKVVQAVRMTVSSLAAFAIAQGLSLPQGFWAVITALIVTQSNVGGSLKAAFDRFFGSVFGAVFGSAVALAIPHEHALSRALALVVAVAPLSFLATFSAGFRVAPITAIIVMLSVSGGALGPFAFAVDRILEVGIGCAVGLLVSVVIVPARASRLLLETAAQVTTLLAEQLEGLARLDAVIDLTPLAVKTRMTLAKLETLVGEAARERRSRLADLPDPEPLLRTLGRLRHDVVMLRRASREPGGEAMYHLVAKQWSHASSIAAQELRTVGEALRAGRPPDATKTVGEAVGVYRTALDDLRRGGLTRPLPTDAVWELFGAGLALEQFRRDLDELISRAREICRGVTDEGDVTLT